MQNTHDFCHLGQAVIELQARAISQLSSRIDENFALACQHLLNCRGRIVVIGVGKSGHIAGKVAATLSSTGSPAFFVHAGEASHGDLGMIQQGDVVILITNSGETPEIVTIVPHLKRLGVTLIALTGKPSSTIAVTADVQLDVSVEQEACPLNLAPTSSTTAALVMGDALAIALLQARGFSVDDFALAHPGGLLGRRLLLRIDDVMHRGSEMPIVRAHTVLRDALLEITEKKLGMAVVVDEQFTLCGIFTDGDLRRTLDRNIDFHRCQMSEVMTTHCKIAQAQQLAVDALTLMEQHQITQLVIVDDHHKPIGVLHMHDLLRAGVV